MRYANLAMSLAAACVAAFAGAQQGIGHPAMADAERAESIERAFLDRVAAARGMKYYTKSTYVSDPPSAALWSFSSDSTMVMSGGLFRFEQPGIVLVAEPESLTMVNLQGQNYGRLDRPAPSEMLGSISMLSFGQADDIWLLHLAGDPEGGVAMMLDSTAYEGITEAPLDDRPGTWVFKTTTLGGDQVRERAWFDAETGLPARYEMDVTDLWAEFIPDGMFGTEPPTLTRVRQIESLEWLDAAPEPAAFELALAGLEPMDTSYFEYWQEMMANGTADEDGDSAGALHGLNEPQLSLVNQPAPSFELPILPADDAAAQVSEELRSLEDYRGRVVVLDFWASWCGPCLRAMPELEAVSTSFADRPVAFIGINSDSPDQYEAALEAVERTGVTFAQLADASDAVGRAYGVTGIPCTVVIDAEGVVRDVHVGYSPDLGAQLTATVETLLSGGSVHDEAMVESLASARRESAERRRAAMPGGQEVLPAVVTLGADRGPALGEFSIIRPQGSDMAVLDMGDGSLTVLGNDGVSRRVELEVPDEGYPAFLLPVRSEAGDTRWFGVFETYDEATYETSSILMASFDADGKQTWAQPQAAGDGFTVYWYGCTADIAGTGVSHVVLGCHIVDSSSDEERAVIEVRSSAGELISRTDIGGRLDGLVTVGSPDGDRVIAAVDGQLRELAIDLLQAE